MDKRADRGMSGKMAGKTVKKNGDRFGYRKQERRKGDKGGVRDRGEAM